MHIDQDNPQPKSTFVSKPGMESEPHFTI